MDDSGDRDLPPQLYAFLDSIPLAEYYGGPSKTDEGIAALCIVLSEQSSETWQRAMESLDDQRRRVLGRYALRAPMLALRTGDLKHLRAGLLADALISQEMDDPRDVMVFFAPYHHAVRVLGGDPVVLFDGAAVHAVPDRATLMRTFCRRTDVTPEVFGWRVVETPDGPSFETLSWHNVPTGAVVGDRSWEQVNRAQFEELMRWVRASREEDAQHRE